MERRLLRGDGPERRCPPRRAVPARRLSTPSRVPVGVSSMPSSIRAERLPDAAGARPAASRASPAAAIPCVASCGPGVTGHDASRSGIEGHLALDQRRRADRLGEQVGAAESPGLRHQQQRSAGAVRLRTGTPGASSPPTSKCGPRAPRSPRPSSRRRRPRASETPSSTRAVGDLTQPVFDPGAGARDRSFRAAPPQRPPGPPTSATRRPRAPPNSAGGPRSIAAAAGSASQGWSRRTTGYVAAKRSIWRRVAGEQLPARISTGPPARGTAVAPGAPGRRPARRSPATSPGRVPRRGPERSPDDRITQGDGSRVVGCIGDKVSRAGSDRRIDRARGVLRGVDAHDPGRVGDLRGEQAAQVRVAHRGQRVVAHR